MTKSDTESGVGKRRRTPTVTEGPSVESRARELLEGRVGVFRGNPAAPLELWINLAELVYPAESPILRELRKALT